MISGTRTAIERAVALGPKYGARRVVLLPVSAPFHCALMQPAAEAMQAALAEVEIKAPSVPVVANVLASAISDSEEIRKRLIEQVTGAQPAGVTQRLDAGQVKRDYERAARDAAPKAPRNSR